MFLWLFKYFLNDVADFRTLWDMILLFNHKIFRIRVDKECLIFGGNRFGKSGVGFNLNVVHSFYHLFVTFIDELHDDG